MNLEIGKTYTTEELIKVLEVSKSTWDHKRKEYLDNLALYYEYEVEDNGVGHTITYHITKKLGEYVSPLRINNKKRWEQAYTDAILDVIKEQPLQTATNLARIIKNDPRVQQYNHADDTIKGYVGTVLNKMYGTELNTGGTHGYIKQFVTATLDFKNNIYIPKAQFVNNWFSNNESKDAFDYFTEMCDTSFSKVKLLQSYD